MKILRTFTFGQLPRILVLGVMIGSPLMIAQNVRAGHENIIESQYEKSSGAGFVLMMGLKRAR